MYQPISRGAIRTIVATLLLGATAVPTLAGPRICRLPRERPLPDHVLEAMSLPETGPRSPWGYVETARRTRANRLALARGEITPAEAEARGGTRVTGSGQVPVFPVLFANTESEPFTPAEIQTQLFDGPYPTGTLKDYYQEVSYGLYSVNGVVDPWFTLSENDTYYEGTSNGLIPGAARTDELIVEVLAARDGAIDFGQFDTDGPDGIPNSGDDDGYVDFIAFVHPEIEGACRETGGGNIWAHQWALNQWTGSSFETDDPSMAPGVANIRVNGYFIYGALDCDGSTLAGIGTFAHEFGHALDIPDLYDTDDMNGPSEGIGHWGLMAAGNWNTPDSPAHMTAWTKERLGWLSYFNVTHDQEQLCIPPVVEYPVALRLWTYGRMGPEYFVAENRQALGFDAQVPAPGLVIYHVDDAVYAAEYWDNTVNGDETHKAIDVECADGWDATHAANADDLDQEVNRGDELDVWCPGTQDEFSDVSIPDTRSYSGDDSLVRIRAIDSCEGGELGEPGWICADVEVGTPSTENACMIDCEEDGCNEFSACGRWWASPDIWIDNDDDGADDHPAEGITNHLWFRVHNDGPDPLANVQVDLYYADPAMGLHFPSTGTLIGSRVIPLVAPGGFEENFIDFVYPTTPEFVDHYCIGAIATTLGDTQSSEFPPNDNNVAQVNHQVLVVRPGSSRAERALVREGGFEKVSKINLLGCGEQFGSAIVRLGSYPEYDDWVLPESWDVQFDEGPYDLFECEPVELWVAVAAAMAEHGETAYLPFTLVNAQTDEPMGGCILEYRVDCIEPGGVDAGATCLSRPGDGLDGPSVRLDWDDDVRDLAGEPERVQYVEVFREDDAGTPLTLIDRVAVDAEPAEAGFQWYDDPPFGGGTVYAYWLRAVDAADAAGPLTGPFVADCALLDASEVPDARSLRLGQNRPNPFNPRTTIAFSLDHAGDVRLDVLDLVGRRVRRLTESRYSAGEWHVTWDGRDDRGLEVPSGVYVYRLTSDGRVLARKMMLLK